VVRAGCAGWALPSGEHPRFAGPGSHLERYARVFSVTEVNSSFHRPHRASTYARWAAATPEGFRFSVKIPKTITHGARLADARALLDEFMAPLAALGGKLECVLVQLPPRLEFEPAVASRFLRMLRERHERAIAVEPRNASWFAPEVEALLRDLRIARVAADPPRTATGGEPGGWRGFAYYRLHGSPRMYYSAYEPERLDALAVKLAAHREAWCIFDNTAGRAAIPNALYLLDAMGEIGNEEKEPALRPRISRGAR
jgi:uncharacterized protein YecE (DUF72 family)